MKYDIEYNSFKFSSRDMNIILNALSFTHWNDKNLSDEDRTYMDGLYQSLENSGKLAEISG